MIKILFVCHGNICRSPMAEFIFKSLIEKTNRTKEFVVDSAATSTEELGNGIYPPALRCLKLHGIDNAVHYARQITVKDYDYYDCIIGMDNYNINNLRRMFGGDRENKISMLNSIPVDDPWYTGDFETAYEEILKGCKQLLQRL